jgi:hypothetical protein
MTTKRDDQSQAAIAKHAEATIQWLFDNGGAAIGADLMAHVACELPARVTVRIEPKSEDAPPGAQTGVGPEPPPDL